MPIDHVRYTARLQKAANRLCAGLPDRVNLRLDQMGQIHLSCRTWSAAMTRTTFKATISLADARKLIGPGVTGTSKRALLMTKALLDDTLALQPHRHSAAEALGLTVQGRQHDLDPSRVLIDRRQKAVLLNDGIDLHAAIRKMGSDNLSRDYLYNGIEQARLDVYKPEVAMLTIEQRGVGHPVLWAWQQVSGNAFYHGDMLDLDISVPATTAIAAAGRRLGDIIATGSAELDERRITYMTTKSVEANRPRDWTVTQVFLEPDLVEVGHPYSGAE